MNDQYIRQQQTVGAQGGPYALPTTGAMHTTPVSFVTQTQHAPHAGPYSMPMNMPNHAPVTQAGPPLPQAFGPETPLPLPQNGSGQLYYSQGGSQTNPSSFFSVPHQQQQQEPIGSAPMHGGVNTSGASPSYFPPAPMPMLTREQLSMDMNASVELSMRVSQAQEAQRQQQMQKLSSSPVMQGRGVTYPYTYFAQGQGQGQVPAPPPPAAAQHSQQESGSFARQAGAGSEERKTVAGPYSNVNVNGQQLVSPQSVFDFGGSNFDLTQQLLQLHLQSIGKSPREQNHQHQQQHPQQRKKLHLLPRTKPLPDHQRVQQSAQAQSPQQEAHGHTTVMVQRPKVDISAVRDRLQVGSCNRNKGKGYAKDHRSKNSSLFGGARPREEVLKERGGYQKPSGLRPETWHYVKKSHNNHHQHQNSHPKRLVTTKTPSPSLSSFHREGKPHQKHPQYQHLVQHQEGSEEKKEDVTVISNPFEFLASVPSGDNLTSLGQ